ncbi:DNA helicase/exodeoxyribonuclease V, subunit B [Lachnospiraceae bacterium KHCPX20]|nr:DNA helicase/exodeoxyribonuclease V, subunit B [Lachnospiraceae bacterium KHCPX20]
MFTNNLLIVTILGGNKEVIFMSMQLILGGSGSGKSTWAFDYMISQAKQHPDRRYIIMVPEQFTMQTQRALVFAHPNKSIMNIDVLSFERLAYRVFDELGTQSGTVLTETGKSLLIRHVASERLDELTVLRRNINRKGYINEVKSLISELEQYHILPEDLLAMEETQYMPASFKAKAEDIRTIYDGYLSYMQGDYISKERILELFASVASDSLLIRDAVICFDGYTGFTPIQKQVLSCIYPMLDQMLCTVTIDPEENYMKQPGEEELFALSKKTIRFLDDLCDHQMLEPVILDGQNGRHEPGSRLFFLQQQLFRNEPGVYEGEDPKAIQIYHVSDPVREILFAAGEIKRLMKENQALHYRDFAVVCANMQDYQYHIKGVFERAEIPLFVDQRQEEIYHPLLEFVDASLELVTDKMSYESVIRLLRTGLLPVHEEEVDLLDNYLYASGVRGIRKFSHPFTRIPKNYNGEKLAQLNEIREKFMGPVTDFYNRQTKAKVTVRERSRLLYELLRGFHIEEQLIERMEEGEKEENQDKSRVNQELYPFLMDLLDQCVELTGDEIISLGDYRDMLAAGLENVSVAKIPQSNDSVMFGDLERTRLDHVQILFLLGANDGAIPRSNTSAGIFSQTEREILKEAEYELAPTDREKAFTQKFYLYMVLTKPSKKLIITYAGVNNEKEATSASYLVEAIEELYPDLHTVEIPDESEIFLQTMEGATLLLSSVLRQAASGEVLTEEKRKLLADLLRVKKADDEEEFYRMLDSAFYRYRHDPISKTVQKALAGDHLRMSVSRLERYAKCAFSYYLEYGLKLQERRRYVMEASDMGEMYHSILEHYSRYVNDSDSTWMDISEEKCETFLDASIQDALKEFGKAELLESPRDAYVLSHIKNTMRRTVWALTYQVRKGSFVPSRFEVALSQIDKKENLTRELSDGSRLELTGKIDRVDLSEDEKQVYVKIIDYKSSNQDIDGGRLYNGIQVQLLFYLNAAVRGIQDGEDRVVKPGAVFYYHVEDPLIEGDLHLPEAKIREAQLKELRANGLVVSDDRVYRDLDSELGIAFDNHESYTSDVIKVGSKKDGEPTVTSKVVSPDDLNVLCDFVEKKTKDLGKEILSGNIEVAPYRMGQFSACDYCAYKSVCGFDPRMDGFHFKDIASQNLDEVLPVIRKELGIFTEEADGEEGEDE